MYLFCRPPSVEEGKKLSGEINAKDKTEANEKIDSQNKQNAKKKGKGKKGKKGKGRGKKSNGEVSEDDRAVLGKFLDSLRGSRRLMVRTFCSSCFHHLFSLFVSESFYFINSAEQD